MTTDIRNQISKTVERLKSGVGGAFRAEAGEKRASAAAASAARAARERASDAELRAALAMLGWVPEQPEQPKRSEDLASQEPTTVVSGIRPKQMKPNGGEAEIEPTAVMQPLSAEDAQPKPEDTALQRTLNRKELFGKLDPELLSEMFPQEELPEPDADSTHVYRKPEQIGVEEPKRKPAAPVRKPKKPEPEAAEAVPEAEETYTERDFRPIRRRRYYRTGLRGGLMYFGFVVCVSVALASLGWLAADDVLSLNKTELEAQVYVGEEPDLEAVASELYGKGLIKYKLLFRVFGRLTHADEKIDTGVYTISSKLDYNAMIHAMQQDEVRFVERDTVTVTIPEGKTVKQTFQLLAERGVCPYETLLDCAANHEFKYGFLSELPYGDATRLEGYLFPDTYQFYASSTPEEAIDKFLANFDAKCSDEMVQEAERMGFSFHEIVTIASLIEMEAGNDTERNTVSSVIHNRLNSSYYPYLQIDATIQYALEERKEKLLDEDLAVDSPYNTYLYTGLPPGPIANPGLSSLRAALAPENTGYYFYALNKSGAHSFFTNQSDFEYFVNSSEFGG